MRNKFFIVLGIIVVLGLAITGCRVRSASQGEPKEPTLPTSGDQLESDNETVTPTPTQEVLVPTTDSDIPTQETASLTPTQEVGISSASPTFEVLVTTEVPSSTATSTATPTATDTLPPTATHTPTATWTPSITPSPTTFLSPTPSATLTFTPFPTITPIQQQQATVVGQAPTGAVATQQINFQQQTATAIIQQQQGGVVISDDFQTATAIVLTFAASQGTFFPTQPGQQPAGPTPTPTQQFPDCDYLIQPGDTLSTIARTYNLTTEEIMARNPDLIVTEDLIEAGDTIVIPSCGRAPTATPTGTLGPSGTPVYDNTTGPIQYEVLTGDNIYRLSVRFGVSMRDILVANPRITDINAIFAGETLTIPARTQFDTQTPIPGAIPTSTIPIFPTATQNLQGGQPAG